MQTPSANTTPAVTLITGANGQLGTELAAELARTHTADQLIITDLHTPNTPFTNEALDVRDRDRLAQLLGDYRVQRVYHLAAILSAKGEQNPNLAWEVNMTGLLNVLALGVTHQLERIFWPSSIAVFGPAAPRNHTPQDAPLDPSTLYGVTKLAGEQLCRYYHQTFGLDVRSLRYPGLISYSAPPGGGTTDYAVSVFYAALKGEPFSCFLQPDATLPMLYMPDALKATLQLMHAPAEQIRVRSSYNLAGFSFDPQTLFALLRQHIPDFVADYAPDFRQKIAESWPASIDDTAARTDWGWQPDYSLEAMVADMLLNLRSRIATEATILH